MAEADKNQLIKRFSELAQRAERLGFQQETKFLSMAEQAILHTLHLPGAYSLCGGYPEAERCIAVFGAAEGYDYAPPIVCVCIAPASRRFADELTHRDFLGSLMALGVTRETLGDIIVQDNAGYLFCLDSIADFIIDNLIEVKRTTVVCSRAELPQIASAEREPVSLVVASERLDAVISAVHRLSREDAKHLVEKGVVFVDGRLVLKGGAPIPEGALVTVRGKGRFKFLGVERETKKGKLRVQVIKY